MAGPAQASRSIQWDPEPVVLPPPDASRAIQWDAPTPRLLAPPPEIPAARPDVLGAAPGSPVQTISPVPAPAAGGPPPSDAVAPAPAPPRSLHPPRGPMLPAPAVLAPNIDADEADRLFKATGLRDLWVGHKREMAGFYHGLANVARAIGSATGTDEGVKVWGSLADNFEGISSRAMPGQTDDPKTIMAKIWQGLGGAPAMVAEFMAAGKVFGTAGYLLPGGAKELDKGPQAATKAALEGYFLGQLGHVTAPLTTLPRIGTMAAVGGASAAAGGGDVGDVAAGAATFGLLGAAGGPGQVRVRDVPGLAREGLRDMASPVASLRGRLAPPPPAPRVEPTLGGTQSAPPAVNPVPPLPDQPGAVPVPAPNVQPPAAGSAIVPPPPPVVEPPRGPNLPPPPEAAPPPVARPPAAPGPAIGGPEEGRPVAPPDAGAQGTAPPVAGERQTITTPTGRKVETQYRVVEADSLATSHGDDFKVNPQYPAELQPRDRTRTASQAQVASIAGNLEPSLLGRSASATDGAPITGPDGVVESGNGRVMALRRVYEKGGQPAEAYRRFVESQGFSTEGMKRPVLVRQRVTPLEGGDRAAFAREANQRTTLSMSATEQATADAHAIPDWLPELYKGGDLEAAGNRDFVRKLVEHLIPASERGAVIAPEGALSSDGRRRLENAIFARTFGAPDILQALRESGNSDIKSIGESLVEASPAFLELGRRATAGEIPHELVINSAVTDAARFVGDARRRGLTVADALAQRDAFAEPLSPVAERVLRLFFTDAKLRRPASRKRIVESLRYYTEQASKAEAGPGLFGDAAPAATAESILDAAAKPKEGGDLFGARRVVMDGEPAAEERRVVMDDDKRKAAFAAMVSAGRARKAEALRLAKENEAVEFGPDQFGLAGIASADTVRPGKFRFTMMRDGEAVGHLEFDTLAEAIQNGINGRHPIVELVPRAAGELPAEGTVAAQGVQNMQPGANYVGFVRDQVHAQVARRGGVPFRRESILADLAKGLGKPIYFGRVKGRSRLGFYRPKQGEVRIKTKGDIETTAHEIAHVLDDSFPEIRAQWHPATAANAVIRNELAGVSYDKTKLYEGFAEFVRLWATQTPEAQARAPAFFKWWERWVNKVDRPEGSVMRRMQVQMTDWFSQNAIDRAASKIGEGADINGFLHSLRRGFRQATSDDLAGILQMENTIKGEKSSVARGAYETARLMRASAAMVEGSLKYGRLVVQPDGKHSYEGRSLFDILDPVAHELDDALRYFVGRSAAETLSQGREKLFTPAEVKGMLSLETPERRQAWEHFKEWQQGALDFAQRKGAIDPAARARWRRMEYLPFFRVQAGGGSARSKGAPGDWHGIKALKGGTGNLRDVLSNVLRNQHMLIEAGLLNEARQKVFKLMAAPGGGNFMAPIGKDSKSVRIMREEVANGIMRGFGDAFNSRTAEAVAEARRKGESEADAAAKVEQQMGDAGDFQAAVDSIIDSVSPMLTLFQHGIAPSGNGVVAALFQGKPSFAEVIDPVLMRAINAMQREPINHPILKILNATRRIGQSSVTLALDFMAANWARDQVMAAIFTRAGYKPFISGAKGLKSRMMNDPAYRDYIANGGGIASNMRDEAGVRRHIGRYYTNRGVNWQNVLETPGRTLDALERIAESFEAATRVEEYKRNVAGGEHPRRAAYLSREISTDWAMRGDSKALGALYDSVLFLKASVVSLDRIYRGFTRDPNKSRVMAITASIAAFSALNYLNNRHRQDYQTMQDAERDIYWHFYVPTPELIQHWSEHGGPLPPGPHGEEQGWWHGKFPKVWEVGAFASIAERELEGILENRPLEAQANVAAVIYRLFSINPIPQIFRPLVETVANKDFFTGSPVVPRGLEDVEPYAQSPTSGSTVLRKAGRLESGLPSSLQVSPAVAEHLLRGYLNSWADYGLRLIDGLAFDDAPRMKLEQAPVIRKFVDATPRQSSRYVEELYNMVGAADEVRATARLMMRQFSPDQTAVELHKPEVAQGIALKGAGKVLGGYRRQLDMVLRAPTLADLQKILDFQAQLAPGDPEIAALKASGTYNSLPRLKTAMRDRLVAMRNQYAEREVKQLGGH